MAKKAAKKGIKKQKKVSVKAANVIVMKKRTKKMAPRKVAVTG